MRIKNIAIIGSNFGVNGYLPAIKKIKNSYIKPIKGMSWTGYDTTILNFLLCNFQKIIIQTTKFIML